LTESKGPNANVAPKTDGANLAPQEYSSLSKRNLPVARTSSPEHGPAPDLAANPGIVSRSLPETDPHYRRDLSLKPAEGLAWSQSQENDLLKPISWRVQLALVGSGYAAVFVVSAALVFGRYLMERYHAADVSAAGGMYAAGDLFLGIFIASLFMIPTVSLVWVMARFEGPYTTYSQVLLGFGLSAPVCLALFVLGNNHVPDGLRLVCLCRLLCSPFALVGMGVSWWVARFDRAKRLTSYALIVEGVTLGVAVGLLLRG
jgi:hypothetical protein